MFLRRDKLKKVGLPDIHTGAEVYSADGAPLGAVKEVGEVAFKVDARLQPDFWLGKDYVLESTPEQVRMSFVKEDLGGYKLGGQGVRPEEDASQQSLVDATLTEEEQVDQRLRMERELAQQRQRLQHEHPEGEEAPPDTGGTLGQPVEEELREHGIEPPGVAPESRVATPTGDVIGDTLVEREEEFAEANEPEPAVIDQTRQRQRPEDMPASGVEYSIPTRHPVRDPAAMRERTALAGVAAIGGAIVAAVSGLLLLLRRGKRRKSG